VPSAKRKRVGSTGIRVGTTNEDPNHAPLAGVGEATAK
jgi:hypothetical protein